MSSTKLHGTALSQSPQRLLIAGYYGFRNAGDEAILHSMQMMLRRRFPSAKLVVLSGDPAETSRAHGVEAVEWTDISSITDAVNHSDLVIIGGGGLFHDYWGIDVSAVGTANHSGLAYYASVAAIAQRAGKPVATWSVGVGPLLTPGGRKLTADVFRSVNLITVRDSASAELLRSIGVSNPTELVADPAFAYDFPHSSRSASGRPLLAVALRNWNVAVDPAEWERQIAEGIDLFLSSHDAEAIFVPFQTIAGELEDDRAVARRVIARLKNSDRCRESSASSAQAVAAEISSADLVLGMRYHSLIFAAVSGVPFVAIEYDPKVGSWAADANVSNLVVDLGAIRGDDLAARLTDAFERRDEIGAKLRRIAEEKRISAEHCVDLLEMIDNSDQEDDVVAALRHELALERQKREEVSEEVRLREGQIAALEADLRHVREELQTKDRVAERLQLPDTRLQSERYDVVCFSIIDWEFRWQRPQQIMSELANRGHRVFYISISRFLPLGEERFRTVQLRDNVWEVQLSVPDAFSVYQGKIAPELKLQIHDDLVALRDEFSIRRAVSITQLATWTPVVLDARESFGWPVVYDCMDEWDTFPGIREAVISNERVLAEQADLLVVTSEKLEKKWKPKASNIVLARNATRFSHFEAATEKPELAELPRPVVGYFGAIADWFDHELMTRLAKERPQYTFVLVGEVFDLALNELASLPNVRLEGARPYAEIPSYLASFDVCIIPFKVNQVTAATDPVKFYEYISQGKPVVSTPMPELDVYRDYLYLAKDENDFLARLDQAVAEDDAALRARRIELARSNDWSARAAAIEEGIANAFGKLRQTTLQQRLARGGDLAGVAIELIEEAVVSRQEAQLSARRVLALKRELTRLTTQFEKDSEAQALDHRRQLESRDRAIVEIQGDAFERVSERDRTIGELQSQLREHVAERDRRIESLQQQLHELSARRQQLEATLHQTAADYQQLDSVRSQTQSMLDEANERLRRTVVDYNHLEKTAMSLRQELHAIHFSKFWKAASAYWGAVSKVKKITGRGTPASLTTSIASLSVDPPAADAPTPTEGTAPASTAADIVTARPNRHDVICFPIIDWNFRFQRPQQLMSQFATHGQRVYYVTQKFRQNGPLYQLEKLADNIYEVSLRGPSKNIYADRLTERETESMFEALNSLRREESLGATVSIVQLPFWTPIAERARQQLAWPMVYDCMDHHAGFTTNTDAMLNEEARLLRTSDLVVVSSPFLEKEAKAHNERVILVRNGCDYEHFAAISEVPNERPVIGYYGAIADWFDSDLVADLARRRPDWDFILVGSTFTADVSRLKKLKNVVLPGEKPYAEIPRWLEKFDVAIIPFKRLPLTEATNPVKAYEMLAGGKPVVSVPIPEVVPMAPLVRLASTAAEFEREIAAALADNDRTHIDARRSYALDNTWAKRYETLEPAIAAAFPKASIVVVTYNSVELNKLCIESLYNQHEWPNFELFVVDNASSDSTPLYLREAEKQFPHLTVILNEDNKGFAAANNQALRVATGDYLVLLNNDTVSPRGWLAALIRHLASDGSIGLIGPSTNAIGNEGIVDVDYKEIGDMPAWAAGFMKRNDGKVFDIAMLAMFCVAMRRDVFEKIGLLDENFGMGMYEDDDYAHRIRLGDYRVVCARDSFVHHWMRAAFGKIPSDEYKALFEKNKAYFESKWATKWVPHTRG